MPIIRRLFGMVKPYWHFVVLSVIVNILFSFFSLFSVTMISPIMQTLFREYGVEVAVEEPAPATVAEAADPADPAVPVVLEPMSRLDEFKTDVQERLDGYLLQGTHRQAIVRICITFFLVILLKNITHYVAEILIVHVGLNVVREMRERLFAAMLRLPLSFFHKQQIGELISRTTNDVQIAMNCVTVSFTTLVRDPLLIIAYIGAAVILSWKMTLLAFLLLPISLAIIIRIGKTVRRYSHRQQEQMARLTSRLQESIYGIRVIKAFTTEDVEDQRFKAESRKLMHQIFKINVVMKSSSPLTEQFSMAVGLTVLWYGATRVIEGGALPADQFIIFLFFIFSTVRPIKNLGQVNNSFQEASAAAERVFSILDLDPEPVGRLAAGDAAPITGRVTMENVTFSYDPGEPVLQDISLTVEPGEVVALVGASGAGKSTLVDLIPRFIAPDSGRVLIDGRDAAEYGLNHLRSAMGMVTQEVLLFHDTIAANIGYGVDGAERTAIEEAAEAANAHDFIMQMPQGYDTIIGDRGVRLSGGQRQRLSIARAILRDPPILLLDEATRALDTESEKLVQVAIDRLVKQRTTFVIAHRLSTVQNVHRIYVMDAGRIVEQGTHEQLLADSGRYRELYRLQFETLDPGNV